MIEKRNLFKINVAAIILNEKKEILLAKRSMTEDVLPGVWGIPGGTVDSLGDIPDILESEVQREIFEEVGISVKNLQYVESHMNHKGKVNICFVCEILSGTPSKSDEVDEVGWFTLHEAEKMELTPHTMDRINLILK